MKKDNYIYIEHILSCIDKIISYTENITEQQFLENNLIQDAVIRNFDIIGEATKQLSKEFREEYHNISWKDIAGMRDILIHDYMGVDIWAVWNTVQNYVPDFKIYLEEILKQK